MLESVKKAEWKKEKCKPHIIYGVFHSSVYVCSCCNQKVYSKSESCPNCHSLMNMGSVKE